MKQRIFMLAAVGLLTACGGSEPPPCLSTWACPGKAPQNPSNQPPPERPPALSQNAIVISMDALISGGAGDYLVRSTEVVNLALSGSNNNVTFDTNQAAGAVSVSGSGNDLIFRPGARVQSLTVTGESNTIWIPGGSSVGVSGNMPASNKVKTYTP